MREYEFLLTRILPYKGKIYDFVLIRENTGQRKPVFSHILCSGKLLLHRNIKKKNTCKLVYKKQCSKNGL